MKFNTTKDGENTVQVKYDSLLIDISISIHTYSLNLRLWILSFTVWLMAPVIGLLTPELSGLAPGLIGDIQLGEGWLMGDNSALAGVPKLTSIEPLELLAVKLVVKLIKLLIFRW